MNHEIRYGVEGFLEEYKATEFEQKMVRDFVKCAEDEKVDAKEAKGAIILLQLAIEMFL